MALFTQVLKSEGRFFTWCPKIIWFGSHRLKAHYPGKLESLRKLREETKLIETNGMKVRVDIPKIFTIHKVHIF